MGDLLGHAVRFGEAQDVMAAGEGIETILSLRQALPMMPMISALSAGHLAVTLFPPHLRRLYIVRDNDPAGNSARDSLVDRAIEAGIEAITLSPMLGDFNDDLAARSLDALRAQVRVQIAPEDVSRHPGRDRARSILSRAYERCTIVGRGPRLGLLRGRAAHKRSGPAMAASG